MKIISLKRAPHILSSLRIFWGNLRKKDRNAPEMDKIKFLKKIPFFENLRRHQLDIIAQIIHEREYNENEFMFEEGQPGAAVFIIQNGEVAVEIKTDEPTPLQIAVLSKGSFVGELALLDESPRSASARSITRTHALALFRSDIDKIKAIDPEITTHIFKALAHIVGQRLKATNELLERRSEAA